MTVVNVKNGELSQQEQEAYIRWATEHYGTQPVSMDIEFDGDFANIHTNLGKHPFERIRRITGYLVGTLDRFNNAKAAEERDRVKHSVTP